MARNPASTSSGQENYVFNVAGIRFDNPSIELKSTLNNSSTIQAYTDNMTSGTPAEVRMVRKGAIFSLYSRPIGSTLWTLRSTFNRPDLPSTLQVGIIAYAYESYPENLLARFDYVRFNELAINFTGNTNSNWSTGSNWEYNNVPTSSKNVFISTGKTVTVDTNTAAVLNIEVAPGASININSNASLTINNNFTNNGTTVLNSDDSSSSSLLIKGASFGNITYNRGGLLANKWSIIGAPITGQSIKTFIENNANDIRINTTPNPNRYGVATYNDLNASGSKWEYINADINATENFIKGKGYAVSRATNGSVSFSGTVNTTSSQYTVIPNSWNAIGNPFTAFIPLNKNGGNNFINDNLTKFDPTNIAVYVWDKAQLKYTALSLIDINQSFFPPGQGFFIKSKTGTTNFTFNEDKRVVQPTIGSSTFNKTTNTTPTIYLAVKKNNNTRVKTTIKYFSEATKGLDPGYDIENFNGADFDVFTHLLEGSVGDNFTIQSLPKSNYETMVIPIGITLNTGTEISFSLDHLNLPTSLKIYLEDKNLQVFKRLDVKNSTYTATILPNASKIGRFFLHTLTKTLNIKETLLEKIKIYQKDTKTIQILGLGTAETTIKLSTLLGQEILYKTLRSSNILNIKLPMIIKGVYIIQLRTENGNLINKKIMLN
jgi:hypothetical protein